MKIIRWVAIIFVGTLFIALCTALIFKYSSGTPYPAWADFLSNPDLFTGVSSLVISVVAFLVTTFLEEEKSRSDRQAKLDAIEKDAQTDFAHALKQLSGLEKESRRWDGDQREWLKRLAQRLESREGFIAFLKQISKAIDNEDEEEITNILECAKNFYRNEVLTILKSVDSVRKGNADINNIKVILSLWDNYDVFSAGLVIYSLNRFSGAVLPDEIKALVEQTEHRRRLKRYKQLAWPGGSGDNYKWPPFDPCPESDRFPALQKWFEKFGIIGDNPFETCPNADPLLVKSKMPPFEWRWMTSSHSGLFTAPSNDDLLSAALMLYDELQNQEGKEGCFFPIHFEVPNQLEETSWLTTLTRRVAETWLEFMAYSPDAYLDMYPEERRALADLFAWHYGSIQIASTRLQHWIFRTQQNEKSGEKQAEGRLVLDLLSKGEAVYSAEIPPSPQQLLDWLSIRPFEMENTIMILVISQPFLPAMIQVMQSYRQAFLARNIILKEFEHNPIVNEANAIQVKWSQDALLKTLAKRIELSTQGRRDSLTSLFERNIFSDNQAADNKLVQKSNGSLSRMLELGHLILLHHAQYHPEDLELLVDDFEVIDKV